MPQPPLRVLLFEDDHETRFRPLTLTRPVYDLRIGHLTIQEKWERELNSVGASRVFGTVRPELDGVFPSPDLSPQQGAGVDDAIGVADSSDSVLWIQSRMLPTPEFLAALRRVIDGPAGVLRHHDSVAAVWAPGEISRRWLDVGAAPDVASWDLPDDAIQEVANLGEHCQLRNIWDLFLWNGVEIERDVPRSGLSGRGMGVHERATIVGSKNLYMHPSAVVEPGSVLIAEEGPILLGEGSVVMAGAMIRGPFSLGKGAVVKMGAKIYRNTTVGPYCVVGGEVSNCIFHSYSNKGHEGYTGNSLFGQWINLGADTNTSNLKANFSTVRVHDWASGEMVDTGLDKIGTIMGDHCKTGINTMLNTGTVSGVSNLIFGSGFPDKLLPSFSWVDGGSIKPYEFDKALEDMAKMMGRRGVTLTDAYKKLMKSIHLSVS